MLVEVTKVVTADNTAVEGVITWELVVMEGSLHIAASIVAGVENFATERDMLHSDTVAG